jgi:uncharacterized membrane protein
MVGYHAHHVGMLLWPFLGLRLLFWAAVIVLVVICVRAWSRPRQGADPALMQLRARLAAGEISTEEYEKTRATLAH